MINYQMNPNYSSLHYFDSNMDICNLYSDLLYFNYKHFNKHLCFYYRY